MGDAEPHGGGSGGRENALLSLAGRRRQLARAVVDKIRRETAFQPWLRALAALLVLAAGAVHLGQVGVHLEEGLPIAGFFLVVGAVQVAGGVVLLRPRGRAWFWFGIAGSAAVIGIWAFSRTLGLPFVGGGAAEPVGVADGFASLAEGWTIIVLGLYLANPSARRRVKVLGLGAALALGLVWLWLVAADAGIFNADPARLAAAQPALVDWLVASAGVALAGSLLIGARAPLHRPWLRGLLRGLAGTFALSSVALVWLTFPPTIGQNVDCRYAPLSTVLIGGHASASHAVILRTGEQRILPLFELHACGSEQGVALDNVEPVTTIGEGATVHGFWLLPVGIRVNAQGQEALPAEAGAVPPGDRIEVGQPRQLVVRLVGTGAGDYILGSVRLVYHTGTPGAFTFATQITVCSGVCSGE